MKTCKICGIEKEDSEFYFNNDKIHLKPYCKICNKRKASEQRKNSNYDDRPENISRRRINENLPFKKEQRKKYYHEIYKLKYPDYNKLYKLKYPEKIAAHIAVQNIKAQEGYEKHHWNYNDEYKTDILFLLKSIHKIAHSKMIYDQEQMMYRDLKGNLLNTKEHHVSYINSLEYLFR